MKKVLSIFATAAIAIALVVTQSESAMDALINFDFALACDGCAKAIQNFDFAVACDGCAKAITDFDFAVACDGCAKAINDAVGNLS